MNGRLLHLAVGVAAFGFVGAVAAFAEETTRATLAPTPSPPYGWALFKEAFNHGDDKFAALAPADYENKPLAGAAKAGCSTSVVSLTIYKEGKVHGKLSFNTRIRNNETDSPAELNGGNTELGGVLESGHFTNYYGYKFEVEIVFKGPLKDAFYGQMISAAIGLKDQGAVFHDDTPANDWVGKDWGPLPAGKTKSDFPVVEVDETAEIVRWIDAPQGSGVSLRNKKYYVAIYAGACGKTTAAKVLKIEFPGGEKPTAKEMTEDEFKKEAGTFKFLTR